jgi:puromycin-sensitive aminopeptidase
MAASDNDARLPALVKPTHYELFYKHLDFERFTFEGSVSIRCTALQSLKETQVVLNAFDLQLIRATLSTNDDNSTTEAETFHYHLRQQRCTIIFGAVNFVQESKDYVLLIDFRGTLNDQMCGLYRSTYIGLGGKTHIMASTQFEATDARRAFPCFDEPALKATFQLKLCIPSHLQCISNTPIASCHTHYNNVSTTKTVTFQTTPKMSTYLLAVVVGQLDGISTTSNHIVTTVYTVPGKAEQGQFCLDVASRCLDLYQELFHIPYPLTKSDLLAIPDFASGAMENWGCVTYREAKILVSPDSTSETTRRGIARTVCHELAHQWFGNLVTMEFWTQLWLKEGVARYMEFVAIDSLFPEWHAWTEFVQSVYGLAMSLDAMQSSHPVEVEVTHPDEISEIFDAISYAKGASLVRMIATLIGKDAFYQGMRQYLTDFAYGNAVTNDLWRALESASHFPVVQFMAPWTLETGFPIVLFADNGSITSTRFNAGGTEGSKATVWPIPVTAQVQGVETLLGPWILNGPNADETETLKSKIAEWESAGLWFKLNVEQTGFYRVSYNERQWEKLSAIMDPNGPLSLTDRLGLLSDSFAAGLAGYTSIVNSLKLVENFGDHECAGT